MAIRISDETIAMTTDCMFSFRCLNGNAKNICKIERCFGDGGCFLSTVNPGVCSYKVSFGHSYICTCPTRSEIYHRYEI